MAGIVYMKSNSIKSLTQSEYTSLNIPTGAKTLYIQTGNNSSNRIKYGLTTDVSASQYSPAMNVNGHTMYIARQETVTRDVDQTLTLSARVDDNGRYTSSASRSTASHSTYPIPYPGLTNTLKSNVYDNITYINRRNVANSASSRTSQTQTEILTRRITQSGYNSYTVNVTGHTIPLSYMDAHSTVNSYFKTTSSTFQSTSGAGFPTTIYDYRVSGSAYNTYSLATDYGCDATVRTESIFITNNIYTGA